MVHLMPVTTAGDILLRSYLHPIPQTEDESSTPERGLGINPFNHCRHQTLAILKNCETGGQIHHSALQGRPVLSMPPVNQCTGSGLPTKVSGFLV